MEPVHAVKLTVFYHGKFVKDDNVWRYDEGSKHSLTVPRSFRYMDLCAKLNEKLGDCVSLKYLIPGETLDPTELVTVADDDDWKEMISEYDRAAGQQPDQHGVFRIKMFAASACHHELGLPQVDEEQVFEDYDTEEKMDEGYEQLCRACQLDDVSGTGMGSVNYDEEYYIVPDGAHIYPADFQVGCDRHTDPLGSETCAVYGNQLVATCVASPETQSTNQSTLQSEDGMQWQAQSMATNDRLPSQPSVDPVLERKVLENINQSLSRYDVAARLAAQVEDGHHMNPYADDCQEQLDRSSSAFLMQGDMRDKVNLPSRISAFGDPGDADCSLAVLATSRDAVKLPSRISIFGELDGSSDMMKTQDLDTPSNIEQFMEDSAAETGMKEWVTQEFGNSSIVAQPHGLNLPTNEFGSVADARQPAAGSVAVQVPAAHSLACSELSPTSSALGSKVKALKSEIVIRAKIGEGAFGEVSQAYVYPYGTVAVKWLKSERFAKYSQSFQREAEVLAQLNHPNIIRMFALVVDKPSANNNHPSRPPSPGCAGDGEVIAGIVTEYVRHGSLTQLLRSSPYPLPYLERCQIALQAALGMAYLHGQTPAVVHFDLKPDNLLVDGVDADRVIKVADFGLSKHQISDHVSCKDLRGTLPYMAPELVSKPNQVSEKCDVWSMGVVLWEMLTKEVPFSHLSAQEILYGLMHGQISLPIPEHCPCEDTWRQLIEACMHIDAERRPTFKMLVQQLQEMIREYLGGANYPSAQAASF